MLFDFYLYFSVKPSILRVLKILNEVDYGFFANEPKSFASLMDTPQNFVGCKFVQQGFIHHVILENRVAG